MDPNEKNARAARRRDNAITAGALLAGGGVAAGGVGAIRGARAIKSGVDDVKRTTHHVRANADRVVTQVEKTGKAAREGVHRVGDAAHRVGDAVGAGAIRGARAIESGVDNVKRTTQHVRANADRVAAQAEKTGRAAREGVRRVGKAAGGPGRFIQKIGRGISRLRKKIKLEAHLGELHQFRASEIRKGVMNVNGTIISVPLLEERLKLRETVQVPWDKVKGMARQKGLTKDRLRKVGAHLERPGIILTDGTLVDGRHRSRMRKAGGEDHGIYKRATKADIKAAAIDPTKLSAKIRMTYFETESPKRMKPGIYHGERPVRLGKVNLPVNHEYVAVIPRKHEKLSKSEQRKLRRVGPNGEKGIVYGAYNDSGTLTPDMSRRSDVDAFRSGKGITYISGRNVDKSVSRLSDHKKKTGKKKYPGLLANITGRGKNSNTYARSALREVGHEVDPKRRNPGSSLNFSEKKKSPEDLNREEIIARKISRGEGIAKAAVGGGIAGGTIAGPVGAVIGAGAGGAAQAGMQLQSEKLGRERKPIQSAMVRALLPTVGGIAIGRSMKGGSLKKIVKKTKAIGRLARKKAREFEAGHELTQFMIATEPPISDVADEKKRKKIKKIGRLMKLTFEQKRSLQKIRNLESKLDRAIEFSRRSEPRRGPGEGAGQYLAGHEVGWGKAESYVPNEHHRERDKNRVNDDRGDHEKERLVRDTRNPVEIPEVRKSFVRQAKSVNKWGGRAVRAGKDLKDVIQKKPRQKDSAGREKKREWEKSYVKDALATGATTAGLFVAARHVRNSPKTQAKIMKVTDAVQEAGRKGMKIAAKYAMSELRPGMIHEFVSVTDDSGRQVFRVEDARGNSARIHSGDKPKRDRRPKRWHEKVENERKLAGAAVLAAGGTGVLVGANGKEVGRRIGSSKFGTAVKDRFKAKPVEAPVLKKAVTKAVKKRVAKKAVKAITPKNVLRFVG